ncbi:hypothetical protein V8G54_024619 [Vigna mungo]|uniref:Uncharacterized protein n=1 Tax=Vigna mungo TaxID=3915 RepID=A0AAQ3RSS1_VIGMU
MNPATEFLWNLTQHMPQTKAMTRLRNHLSNRSLQHFITVSEHHLWSKSSHCPQPIPHQPRIRGFRPIRHKGQSQQQKLKMVVHTNKRNKGQSTLVFNVSGVQKHHITKMSIIKPSLSVHPENTPQPLLLVKIDREKEIRVFMLHRHESVEQKLKVTLGES